MSTLPLLLLVACSPCPTLADMKVTDPEGIASPEQFDIVYDAITEFALWTGEDAVCVSEMRFREDFRARKVSWSEEPVEIGGIYTRKLDLIRLDADAPGLAVTAAHELCHAIDHGVGDYSEQNPELFTDISEPDLPPNEVFADLCEQGPRSMDLLASSSCGVTDVERFLLDEVFTGPWREPYAWQPLELQEHHLLPQQGELTGAVSGAGAVVLAQEVLAGVGARALQILQVEVETGLVGQIEVSLGPETDGVLLGGDAAGGGPLLVTWEERARAWRISGPRGRLVEVPFPSEITGISSGVLSQGAAWIEASVEGDDPAWYRVDLVTGALDAWRMPRLSGRPGAWAAGSGRLTAAWHHGETHSLVSYDLAEARWTISDARALALHATAPLADGRTLFRWSSPPTGLSGFGWYDPRADLWTLGQEPCEEQRAEREGDLVVVEGQPWWLERGQTSYRLATVALGASP